MKFNIIVCGGTFDHFHKGHESFLRYVFSVGKKIIVGVTSDNYVRNLKSRIQNSEFETFEEREKSVLEFIKSENVSDRAEIVEINDLFGPTLDKNLVIDAIVVSEDTKKGADIVNQKRVELGMSKLKVFVSSSIKAEDGEIISSARIRKGEINKKGDLYVKSSWLEKDLVLPENLRQEFKKPLGELFEEAKDSFKSKDSLIITVGDITAKAFNKNSLGQNISVIDFKVARENKFSNISELGFTGNEKVFRVDNPAGSITSNLFKKIKEIFKEKIEDKIILQVIGEEDLAVLPLVLLSPLNTIIYYGQPGKGLVRVVVSNETKEKAYNLVLKLKLT